MEENRTTRKRSSATRPPRRSARLFSNRRFVCSAEAKAHFVPKKNLRHDDSSISRRRCSTAKKRATSTVRGGPMRARVATRPTAMRARASALLARATLLRSRCWRPRPRRVMGLRARGRGASRERPVGIARRGLSPRRGHLLPGGLRPHAQLGREEVRHRRGHILHRVHARPPGLPLAHARRHAAPRADRRRASPRQRRLRRVAQKRRPRGRRRGVGQPPRRRRQRRRQQQRIPLPRRRPSPRPRLQVLRRRDPPRLRRHRPLHAIPSSPPRPDPAGIRRPPRRRRRGAPPRDNHRVPRESPTRRGIRPRRSVPAFVPGAAPSTGACVPALEPDRTIRASTSASKPPSQTREPSRSTQTPAICTWVTRRRTR